MKGFELSPREVRELQAVHRCTREKRYAYRLNALILLGSGWSMEEVAEALLLDEGTLRHYVKRYRQGGIAALVRDDYTGGSSPLTEEQLRLLDEEVGAHTYLRVQDIQVWVEQQFGVSYSLSGLTELLHRLRFVYKKPKVVPGKADPKAQEAFLRVYETVKADKGPDDPIYFMDGVHPQHNTLAACGWIKKGSEKALPSNTGRQRLNINGALNIESLEPTVRFDDRINAQSTVALFQELESAHPNARVIHVIADNAPYYRARHVQDYLQTSKIQVLFLPPYSPNLNLIERYWKFFKKKVLYNRYYPTFEEFKTACIAFFERSRCHQPELRSLLAENFHIIPAPA